mgnify:CR=1 FL=1
MTIRDRIFARLLELHMTQKQFSEKTGIPQSTISEWKSKKTNPTADKIMIICQVLEVSPEWLLSGIENEGKRVTPNNYIVVDKDTEIGELIKAYSMMPSDSRARVQGYVAALAEILERK